MPTRLILGTGLNPKDWTTKSKVHLKTNNNIYLKIIALI
jgi:hypothetical protein